MPRREPGAVVGDPDEVVARAVRLACGGGVVSREGTAVRVAARSLCVHGDTPGAALHAVAVREALEAASVRVAAFA